MNEDEIPYVFGDPWDFVYHRTHSILREMGMDCESIAIWFHEPNSYLYGSTPWYEIESGHYMAVYHAACVLREGSFGRNPTNDESES